VVTEASGSGLVAVAPGCPLMAPPRTPGSVCACVGDESARDKRANDAKAAVRAPAGLGSRAADPIKLIRIAMVSLRSASIWGG
jgi:hypothetical protein